MNPDHLRLYLVTDSSYRSHAELRTQLPALVKAGVTMLQLRDKAASTRTLLELARAYLEILRPLKVPLIVNDRADVALAAGADGVHVGSSDLPADAARLLLGPTAWVGLSVERPELPSPEALRSASYIAASPVHGTPTKLDTAPPLGMDGVRRLAASSPVPVIGIGGLNEDNVGALGAAGAEGAAVISAILAHPDPVRAAGRIRHAFDEGRKESS